GYYNVNSSHPLENPTPFSNFLEMLAILLIPAALCYTFGVMVKDRRQGWALLATMTIIFVAFLIFCYSYESKPNPLMAQFGVSQPLGNMEGKETRFGVGESVLWATATTAASNGSVNSMHDSFMPLGGLVPLVMMLFGEVIFGGVGSGLYGMIAFVIVAVFVAGLMVGRTPEYLGKKIESFEMKMSLIALLITPLFVLTFTALALMTTWGKATIFNSGMHGFSEVLYAFSSATNNNGSAFAGLGANNPFYNLTLGLAMFFGRYWIIIPTLAMAGSLARKQKISQNAGTLETHTPLFVGWLIATIILLVVLNYLPALALGPLVEHLMLNQGLTF
nr:potassium-transporting ATPase subunit A [Candidatus Omnitrophota bacterium]